MRRNIVIAVVALVILGAGIYFWQRRQAQSQLVVNPTPTPSTLASENDFEDRFKVDIPDDADKVELEDQADGDASGIATREFKDNKFTLIVLADLPEAEVGTHYQAWLEKGEEGQDGFERIKAGILTSVKGGFSTTFDSETDLTDYSRVVVSRERVADNTLEEVILRATF